MILRLTCTDEEVVWRELLDYRHHDGVEDDKVLLVPHDLLEIYKLQIWNYWFFPTHY